MRSTKVLHIDLRVGLLVPILMLLAWVPGASAQTGSVQGYVRDDAGAAIYAASVQIYPVGSDILSRATETDRLGYFLLEDIGPGQHELVVGRLGFAQLTEVVTVPQDQRVDRDILLTTTVIELEGVSVEAERSRERVRFEEQAGITIAELAGRDVKMIPGVAEADPLRAIEVLPGVISTSDFSAAFNVRGGSADQNLILLDGVPIFNPFHLAGFFSVFNADMLARVELLAGGFPAEYGGRVSAVLNVESDPGNGEWDFDGGISVLASRLAVGGGLPESVRDKVGLQTARWRVSARRSYFDVLLKPAFDFPYHLTDLQGVFEGWTRGGSKFTISAYSGTDAVDFSDTSNENFPLKVDWGWGNDVIGLRWSTPSEDGGSLEVRSGFSRFDTDLAFPDFGDFQITSKIDLFSNGIEVERRPARHWTVKAGVNADRSSYDNRFATGGTDFRAGSLTGWMLGSFVQAAWNDQRNWLVEAGVRVDNWRPAVGETLVEVAPRLAVKRFVANKNAAVKLSVGRYTQFLHSVRDEELPLGLDIWVLTGERAPQVVSDQVQFGVEGYPKEGWFVSAEGYLRSFDGVITNNFADDPNTDRDDLLRGTGEAYGADFFVRKTGGETTGWLSLSLLKTERTFPDFLSGLDPAPDLTYAPIFDRRVDIDLVLRRRLSWGVEGGLRWNFGSGLPYTRAVGSYGFYSPQLSDGGRLVFGPDGGFDDYAILVGARNAERYPAYHRLDMSFRKPMRQSWGTLVPYLNVLNLYNRRNVLFYFFDYQVNPAERTGVSMFPLLPTIGVEISF